MSRYGRSWHFIRDKITVHEQAIEKLCETKPKGIAQIEIFIAKVHSHYDKIKVLDQEIRDLKDPDE